MFFVFFGENLKQVLQIIRDCMHTCIVYVILRYLMPVDLSCLSEYGLLSCYRLLVRNLDTLAPLSSVGNIGLAFGLGSILYYITNKMVEKNAAVFHDNETQAAILSMTGLPVFFGNVLFTYEAIGMVHIKWIEYKEIYFYCRYFQLRTK